MYHAGAIKNLRAQALADDGYVAFQLTGLECATQVLQNNLVLFHMYLCVSCVAQKTKTSRHLQMLIPYLDSAQSVLEGFSCASSVLQLTG